MCAGESSVLSAQRGKIFLGHVQIVGAGRPQAIQPGGVHQKFQRHPALGQIFPPQPVQGFEQGHQHGPGHIVLVAHLPGDVGPAEHALKAARADLHFVVDKSFQVLGPLQAAGVAECQKVHQIGQRRFAAAVSADGGGGFLVAVGVNFGAQPFQHASFALIHQNAGTAEPVDAAGGTVGGGTGKAGLVLRRKLHLLQNRRAAQPANQRAHQSAPGRHRRESRPQKVAQPEGADGDGGGFQPDAILLAVGALLLAERLAGVFRQPLFIH